MKKGKARRFFARRSRRASGVGRGLAAMLLLAALGIPTAATASPVPVESPTPGPASPVQTPPQTPPAIANQVPHDGVITPPAGISRMPVIHPKVPTRTPVIPPAGSPGGNQHVVPK